MTLDGLQSRTSMTVEGMASQHASHQNMLNTVAAAQMANAVSKNGSIAAMNELSDAQEAQLQNAVAEARSSGKQTSFQSGTADSFAHLPRILRLSFGHSVVTTADMTSAALHLKCIICTCHLEE